ncbi:DUF6115 domain-containing protein [Aquibacillus sediminis]|uniref:DUF6115 domain-containing protein n=1 Tax=Aquibacillus sediminis TaxID=2574734 RepID=UPI001109DFA4|nr:hypothetical protein [Aquibacillus sediminis]
MVTFILVISLILHLMTFIIIRVMMTKLKRADQLAKKQTQSMKEIEELFSVYLVELKEENQKLLDHFPVKEHQQQSSEEDIMEKKATAVKRSSSTVQRTYSSKENKRDTSLSNQPNNYQPPLINDKEDIVEQSTSATVYSLYDQGYSVNDIAKKLDCGKTEVELMLKFYRKNS